MLQPYAASAEQSRGRFYPIHATTGRNDYQRDRDRIIHSKAFRRLAHKTQVFVYYEGDHYRNRLTHSLEVAQITRAVARILGVNEDLAETTALAHDLGHPPFGHAGEEALNEKMKHYGGFDHNAQSLRVVTHLENRYPDYLGLNLTMESLEGVLKHNGPIVHAFPDLPRAIKAFTFYKQLNLDLYAGVEAQIAALCDDIAYNAHDIDDGLRANMFDITALEQFEFCAKIMYDIKKCYPDIAPYPFKHEFIRRLITFFVEDMLQATRHTLADLAPKSYEDICHAGKTVVHFSEEGLSHNKMLKKFLLKNMYRHYRVNRMTSKAKRVVGHLFDIYMAEPDILPETQAQFIIKSSENERAILIADFIAGMTDKFALEEHKKLFDLASEDL